MSLLTPQRYRTLTGDFQTPEDEVTEGLATAQREVEEFLRRPLESLERTESLILYANGRLYPRATPVTVVPTGYTVEGNAVLAGPGGVTEWPQGTTEAVRQSLTYTGGWTASTLPRELERAIAETAQANLAPSASDLPAGVRSATLGDATVTFDEASGGVGVPADVKRRIHRWRRARVAVSSITGAP